jgi:hypothetical protein
LSCDSPHSQIPSVGCLYFHWRGGLEMELMLQLRHFHFDTGCSRFRHEVEPKRHLALWFC